MLFHEGYFGAVTGIMVGIFASCLLTLAQMLGNGDAHLRTTKARLAQVVIWTAYASGVLLAVNWMSKADAWPANQAIVVLTITLTFAFITHALLLSNVRFRRTVSNDLMPNPLIDDGYEICLAKTHSAVGDYQDSIVNEERRASELAYIQVRIPPYYYSEAAVRYVSELRFGEGSPLVAPYLEGHKLRVAHHASLLGSGVLVREIYQIKVIESFVRTGTHSKNFWPLSPQMVVEALQLWKRQLTSFENYTIGLTKDPVGAKYHILSRKLVVLHDPVGGGQTSRLNSLFLQGPIVEKYCSDFEFLWDRIPPKRRSSTEVAQWIEDRLIPLAMEREA